MALSTHEHQRAHMRATLEGLPDELVRRSFAQTFASVNELADSTRAPDVDGAKGAMRRLCEKLTRPGAADMRDLARYMYDITVEVEKGDYKDRLNARAGGTTTASDGDEACEEFCAGPPGQAIRSGLRWCAAQLHHLAEESPRARGRRDAAGGLGHLTWCLTKASWSRPSPIPLHFTTHSLTFHILIHVRTHDEDTIFIRLLNSTVDTISNLSQPNVSTVCV